MSSTRSGHIGLEGKEYVIQEDTYRKQLQTPYNPRFATGEPQTGDQSFFQFLSMNDWSGGEGQEIFKQENQFFESNGIDVTTPGELKLAPQIEWVCGINGAQHEHLDQAIEQEDAWPQVIEWRGKPIFFNDTIHFDAGGLEFLDVFETDVLIEQVVTSDQSGTQGNITNDTRAEIISISKPYGLPDDVISIKVKYKAFVIYDLFSVGYGRQATNPLDPPILHGNLANIPIKFRLDFGTDVDFSSGEGRTAHFVEQEVKFLNNAFAGWTASGDVITPAPITFNQDYIVEFTFKVPKVNSGVYKIWTSVGWGDGPFTLADWAYGPFYKTLGIITNPNAAATLVNIALMNAGDKDANASVKFFVQGINSVTVNRHNLYAPQLMAATVIGENLVGGRVYQGVGYIEVYAEQNDAVDRTLQINLVEAAITPTAPTYMEFIGNQGVLIAALDNKIYAVDITTVGLTDAQRMTLIGTVPGTYVSGMAIWNQRVYIASFDKNTYESFITWTNGTEIEDSYAIDGKFWITDLVNFNGGLFYSGGTQDRKGAIFAFPSSKIIELTHPTYDMRIRSMNAGRQLYFSISHAGENGGLGLGVLNEKGVSKWALYDDIIESPANVVWDIEEVGETVYFLGDSGAFKTNRKFQPKGWIDSSRIGANTPMIDKNWASIILRAHDIKDSHTVRVLAKNNNLTGTGYSLLGEWNGSEGLEKEILFPKNFTSSDVVIRIEISTSDEFTTPKLKEVILKYVPNVLNKRQWVFTVRAVDGIVLLDGRKDDRTGAIISSDLWSLSNLGTIVFRDLDEQEYNVILTDMQEFVSLENKTEPESLVSLELLEA